MRRLDAPGDRLMAAYEATLRDCRSVRRGCSQAWAAAIGPRAAARQLSGLDHPRGPRPGPSAAALLQADRNMLQQAFDDLEGIGSHNPMRPLDDHVELAERPTGAGGAHGHQCRAHAMTTRWPLAAYTISFRT